MSAQKVRVAISVVAAVFIVLHLVFPDLEIDATTLALLVLGVAPWLAPVVKSLELPGGLKVELQELEAASGKVVAATSVRESSGAELTDGIRLGDDVEATVVRRLSPPGAMERLQAVVDTDPALALVSLRIEIETRLREAAELVALDTERSSPARLLRSLAIGGFIPESMASGLADLIQIGNRAAHGVEVPHETADWALTAGPQVLEALEDIPLVWEAMLPFDPDRAQDAPRSPALKRFAQFVRAGQNKSGRWFVIRRDPSRNESAVILFDSPTSAS